jgi:hypothetical protein
LPSTGTGQVDLTPFWLLLVVIAGLFALGIWWPERPNRPF